jgi:hypothetical protein
MRNRHEADQSNGNKHWYTVDDWPHLIVTLAGVVVVCFYTVYACQQVSETQRANQIAKSALAETNKPYVNFEGLFPNKSVDSIEPHAMHEHVGFILRNYGNTPALSARIKMCKPLIRDNILPPEYKCEQEDKTNFIGIISPKQGINIIGPVVPDGILAATKIGSKVVYIIGYIEYADGVSFDAYNIPLKRAATFCQQIVQSSIASGVILPAGYDVPIVGLGCKDFPYCVDAGCELP